MTWMEPCLQRCRTAGGDLVVSLGVPLLDGYLEFLAVRSRPNTVLAAAYDLKVFFCLVGKPPHEVTSVDVFGFITAQYTGGGRGRLQPVTQTATGVSARTVRRRLSSVSGLFAFGRRGSSARAVRGPVAGEWPTAASAVRYAGPERR